MAILKCKMCGGDVELLGDKTFGTCEYCGCTMTFPKVDDEQRAAAFNRGNHFRRIGEFDKALAVYERIVQEDDTDAEAHWCCALCRFGIEYVEDPATMEWLPTCHRASFDSFMEDVDYLAAVKYSTGITQRQYQKDAAKIADVQRGILATSQNAEPYDVFICYKETDEQGGRTRDSLLAQEIYYQLTEQGRKVFFSRITLEDVAGTQYEPYIFAALNSAKVMIVVGTRPEHLSSVWVKNEWSRFLSLMKKDHGKLLLPCYRDMDPYDLPEQLSVLQSYDMAKIGFIQDLIRGVAKVLDAQRVQPVVQMVQEAPITNPGQIATLLKRVYIFLEDGDWVKADDFCEQVLNIDPECAEAYLCKLMVELRVRTREELKNCALPFDRYNNFQKAMRFGDEEQRNEYRGYITAIQERNLEKAYEASVVILRNANTTADCEKAARQFAALGEYRDAVEMVNNCHEKSRALEYAEAERLASRSNVTSLQKAVVQFRRMRDYRDAAQRAGECEKRIVQILVEQEKSEQKRKAKKALILGGIAVALVLVILIFTVWVPNARGKQLGAVRAAISDYQHLMSAGGCGVFAVTQDGTLLCRTESFIDMTDIWAEENIVSVAVGAQHVVFLKADGDVITAGYNSEGQRDVGYWGAVAQIGAGAYHTVGLREDGTVLAVGWDRNNECDVYGWTGVEAIAVGAYHTVGLQEDGTVLATGSMSYGQCSVGKWKNIVAIAAGESHTVGVKNDGTVVAVGNDYNDQCDVSDWEEIVAVAAGDRHTVGLRADGTVVAVGDNYNDQLDVEDWEDIVAIEAGPDYTIGLKEDGTVVCTTSRFETYTWDLF